MKTKKQNVLPILLIGSGLFLLVGCIYVPYLGATGQNTSRKGAEVTLLGGRKSSKHFQDQYLHTFRIGVTTRDEVIREMFDPTFTRSGGKALVYYQHSTTGYWIYPLCFFHAEPDGDSYLIQLDFDERGALAASNRDIEDVRSLHGRVFVSHGPHPDVAPR